MKKYLLILFIALFTEAVQAQKAMIVVKETTTNPVITLELDKQPIVDINSKLTVQIDRNVLVSSLPGAKKSNPVLTAKLTALIDLMKTEQQLLASMKPAIANAAVNPESLKVFSRLMLEFYQKLTQNPELRQQVNLLFKQAIAQIRNKTFDTTKYSSAQAYVILHLDSMMSQVTADISAAKDVSSYSIQLQAYISTKAANNQKVHIENFDNYSAGEYYQVPRWVTSFSQGDVDAFNQVAKLSTDLNLAVSGNFNELKALIPDSLNAYKCFSSLVDEAKADEAAMAGHVQSQATAFVSAMQTKLADLLAAIQQFQKQKDAASANPLQQFNQLSSAFLTLAGSLPAQVDSLKNLVAADVFNASADLKKLYTGFKSCNAILQADVKLVSGVYKAVVNLLQPIQGTATAAQQVTGNVFDLNINQIPPIGYIDLKYSGRRQNGDVLEIKLVTRTPDDIAKNLPGLTLDDETIEMQQISFYSESSIGVILASPIGTSNQVTLTNKFQFAPSGSLVVKFGSRKCRFWNTINPGVGFNISTPDFNLDGSPDVSYGGVLTLFHNIVSAGWAYNTKTSSPFWFFGLSLPFTTFGLPVGNVQTQKQ